MIWNSCKRYIRIPIFAFVILTTSSCGYTDSVNVVYVNRKPSDTVEVLIDNLIQSVKNDELDGFTKLFSTNIFLQQPITSAESYIDYVQVDTSTMDSIKYLGPYFEKLRSIISSSNIRHGNEIEPTVRVFVLSESRTTISISNKGIADIDAVYLNTVDGQFSSIGSFLIPAGGELPPLVLGDYFSYRTLLSETPVFSDCLSKSPDYFVTENILLARPRFEIETCGRLKFTNDTGEISFFEMSDLVAVPASVDPIFWLFDNEDFADFFRVEIEGNHTLYKNPEALDGYDYTFYSGSNYFRAETSIRSVGTTISEWIRLIDENDITIGWLPATEL